MAGFGRAPKPDSQRRRTGRELAASAEHRLPRSGRQGKPPAWPLDGFSARERVLWRRLWATPQATAWESLGWTDAVARYARILTAAERVEAPVALLAEARQLEDRLGLSPMAMLRLRWQIVDDSDEREEAPEGTVDIRERLRAVE